MFSAAAITLLVLGSLSIMFFGMTISNERTCDISVEESSKQRFITRATHKDVKLLYLGLLFLNESNTNSLSFNEDISTIYDPLRWVWTNSEQGKAILSLPYDYKILSCTTLSRETDKVNLSIITQPPGCFSQQNGQNQLTYVMNVLKETAKALSSNSVVCHRFVEDTIRSIKIIYQTKFSSGLPTIRYRCCSANKQDAGCSIMIVPNTALAFILRAIWVVSCFVPFFTPLLIKYLPNDSNETSKGLFDSANSISIYELNCPEGLSTESNVVNLEAENHAEINEDEYINLNTSTPLTGPFISNARVPSYLKMCPRLSRFLFFFTTTPAILIVALILYSLLLKSEVELQKQAEIKTDFLQMCLNPDVLLLSRTAAYIVSCVLLCAPANVSNVVDESLILIGDLQYESSCCFICTAMKHTPNKELTGVQLLYDNMRRHLKYLLSSNFWKVSFCISSFPSRWLLHFFKKGKRLSMAELLQPEQFYDSGGFSCWYVVSTLLWILLSPIWIIAFFLAICVTIFLMVPIGYFLACICFVPLVFLTQKFGNSVFTWLVFLVCFLINVLSACFLIEMITFSWSFVLKLIGFTLMGLVVGIDYYIPYLVYTLALLFYFQNIGRKLSDKYLKLKVLLFEECEKQQQELEKQMVDVPILFIKNKKTEMPMIPKELFEIVCNKYLPLKKAIASSIFTLLVIILFLTFAFASVMAFGKWAKLPSLTEAIVTALISTLPKLLRNTGKQAGWSLLKEKKQLYSLEVTVSQFVRKQKNLH